MPDFKVFPDRPDVLDRAALKPDTERLYFRERQISQGAELNEAFSLQDAKRTRIADMTASDGDRLAGAELIVVDREAGNFDLTAGRVYVQGDVRSVAASSLTGVDVVGDIQIGIRLKKEVIDHEDDADLLGQYPGALSEGEPGAIRLKTTLEWGWSGDEQDGDLFTVYTLRDGYVIDQTPPPNLSGVARQIASQVYGADGNYIDEGCLTTALGKIGDDQVFNISEGAVYVLGFPFTRSTASRFSVVEEPDIETVTAEFHTYIDDGGICVIKVNHAPINGITSVGVTKSFTETLIRGVVADTADSLTRTGVQRIVEVVSGGTTYVLNTDYVRTGDTVDWLPGGAEPASGVSFDITYEYIASVAPDAFDGSTITVSDGVEGGLVVISYSFKLPRVDLIGVDHTGNFAYLYGISAREQPQPPLEPENVLALCEIRNSWVGKPTIRNNGTRNNTYKYQTRLFNKLFNLIDTVLEERLQRQVHAREPNAKYAMFVDPFVNDAKRDVGEAQDAAVFDGTCQLAVDPSFHFTHFPSQILLDYTDEVVMRQEQSSGCFRINEYDSFRPIPISLTLTPSRDFWEVSSETWLSPITRVFGQGSQSRVISDITLENIQTSEATFLRQIPIFFEIGGLGVGEIVNVLSFDTIDVNIGGLVGNASGVATGTFNIPANVTTGVKQVRAVSASGSIATAIFEGRGALTETTRQRITEIRRREEDSVSPAAPDPIRRSRSFGGDGGGGSNNLGGMSGTGHGIGDDPVAQTFALTENRMVTGVDVKFCRIGNTSKPVICELVAVDNGYPTRFVLAQATIDMATVILGVWTSFNFIRPVFIPLDTEFAVVFKTDDGDHSLQIATRGEFDAAAQKWIAAQPYTVGVFFSSSNATAWTAHQDIDLTVRVRAAVFSPTTKVVDLGTFPVTDMSDIIVSTIVELPTPSASFLFRVTPAGQTSQLLANNQNWERDSYFTGDVKIEALLTGDAKISPILHRDILTIPGSMRASGTYVTRVFQMGTAIRQDVRVKTKIPTGATITVELDAADDIWVAAPFEEALLQTDGTLDQQFKKDPFTAALGGRVKITLTGTPAARPSIYDLRSFSV